MNIDMPTDLAALTTITKSSLRSMASLQNNIIAHAVFESKLKGDKVTEINLGYGTLKINVDNGDVKFKFISSYEMKNMISDALLANDSSQLIELSEETLAHKISNAYKDLFY